MNNNLGIPNEYSLVSDPHHVVSVGDLIVMNPNKHWTLAALHEDGFLLGQMVSGIPGITYLATTSNPELIDDHKRRLKQWITKKNGRSMLKMLENGDVSVLLALEEIAKKDNDIAYGLLCWHEKHSDIKTAGQFADRIGNYARMCLAGSTEFQLPDIDRDALYLKAAETIPEAALIITCRYFERADYESMMAPLKLALEFKCHDAFDIMGWCYLRGYGVPINRIEAVKSFLMPLTENDLDKTVASEHSVLDYETPIVNAETKEWTSIDLLLQILNESTPNECCEILRLIPNATTLVKQQWLARRPDIGKV